MGFESIKYNSSLRVDTLCIQTKKWENSIEFYGLNRNGVKIPCGETPEFIKYIKENVNGEENVSLKINGSSVIEIPKSKIGEIEKRLIKFEKISKEIPASKEIF